MMGLQRTPVTKAAGTKWATGSNERKIKALSGVLKKPTWTGPRVFWPIRPSERAVGTQVVPTEEAQHLSKTGFFTECWLTWVDIFLVAFSQRTNLTLDEDDPPNSSAP